MSEAGRHGQRGFFPREKLISQTHPQFRGNKSCILAGFMSQATHISEATNPIEPNIRQAAPNLEARCNVRVIL